MTEFLKGVGTTEVARDSLNMDVNKHLLWVRSAVGMIHRDAAYVKDSESVTYKALLQLGCCFRKQDSS